MVGCRLHESSRLAHHLLSCEILIGVLLLWYHTVADLFARGLLSLFSRTLLAECELLVMLSDHDQRPNIKFKIGVTK